ncbi:RNA polymerase sigma factor RpoD, partial [bacterium]
MATKNRERKDSQQLVDAGKAKGYLTYDEVNDSLPADAVSDQMDDVMSVLVAEDADGNYQKSNDPVRLYLRKMGSVSLLTREGEVEIAKRIEQGEHSILHAILNSPVAVREIIDLGDKLRKHKIRVKDIIRDADDEDREFDEEEADRRTLRLIDKVKVLDKSTSDLVESLASCTASRKKAIDAEIEGNKAKLVDTLEEMRLN